MKKLVKKLFNLLGYELKRTSKLPNPARSEEIYETTLKKLVNAIGPEIVYYMASTGDKTDECMNKGCLPVLTHFYQPIPDIKDLEQKKVWDKVSELRGITWEPQKFLQMLNELSVYAGECDWQNEPTHVGGKYDPMEFYLNNKCFSYGCAAMLHCIIRKNKPLRIIEVGYGNSSRVIAAALSANILENNSYNCEYIIIDTYSSIDVNFEILEILPVLNSGVYIHFHDINLPYEFLKHTRLILKFVCFGLRVIYYRHSYPVIRILKLSFRWLSYNGFIMMILGNFFIKVITRQIGVAAVF